VEPVLARAARMRRVPERGHEEQQVAQARGDPVPVAHQQDKRGHDPHPVMGPGDRGHEQPGGPGDRRRAQPVLAPRQHRRGGQPDGGERDRDDDVPVADVARALGDPDRGGVRRLVADVGRADPPGVVGQVLPVPHRGVRRDQPPDEHAGAERDRPGDRRLGPPGQQEEHDEDRGRQLDRGRRPDQDSRAPATGYPPDVGQDQGQQDQVDLAQEQRLVHRVQRQRGRGDTRRHDPRRPVAREPERDHARVRERRDRGQVPGHPHHGERQRRERHEHHGRERRVGEPVAERLDLVQPSVVQDRVPAPHVDAEIQRVVRGREPDDHREPGPEHAVNHRRDPPSGRPPRPRRRLLRHPRHPIRYAAPRCARSRSATVAAISWCPAAFG
jgi:hypothetical protein